MNITYKSIDSHDFTSLNHISLGGARKYLFASSTYLNKIVNDDAIIP